MPRNVADVCAARREKSRCPWSKSVGITTRAHRGSTMRATSARLPYKPYKPCFRVAAVSWRDGASGNPGVMSTANGEHGPETGPRAPKAPPCGMTQRFDPEGDVGRAMLPAEANLRRRFRLHIPARENQDRRVASQRSRDHFGTLDPEVDSIILDPGNRGLRMTRPQ